MNHRTITVLLLIVAGFCDASTRLSVGNFFKLKWHGNLVKLQGISQIDKKKNSKRDCFTTQILIGLGQFIDNSYGLSGSKVKLISYGDKATPCFKKTLNFHEMPSTNELGFFGGFNTRKGLLLLESFLKIGCCFSFFFLLENFIVVKMYAKVDFILKRVWKKTLNDRLKLVKCQQFISLIRKKRQ